MSKVNDVLLSMEEHHHSTPGKVILSDAKQQLTWFELDRRLNQVANSLIQLQLKPNQDIAILASNSVNYATLFLGSLRARRLPRNSVA